MSRSNPAPEKPRKARVPKPEDPNVITATGHDAFMKVIQRERRGEIEIKSLDFTPRNATVKFRVVYKIEPPARK